MVDYLCAQDLQWRQVHWEKTLKGEAATDDEVEKFLKKERSKQDENVPEEHQYNSLRTWMYETEKKYLGPDEDLAEKHLGKEEHEKKSWKEQQKAVADMALK